MEVLSSVFRNNDVSMQGRLKDAILGMFLLAGVYQIFILCYITGLRPYQGTVLEPIGQSYGHFNACTFCALCIHLSMEVIITRDSKINSFNSYYGRIETP